MAGFVARIHRACSTWQHFHESLEKAKAILEKNQYPPFFYNPIISEAIEKLMGSEDQRMEKENAKSGKEAGKTYTVVQRTMKPLKAPGMEKAGIYHYLEYRDDEVAIMKPGRKFRVKKPGCTDAYEEMDFTKKRQRDDVEERPAKKPKVIDLTDESDSDSDASVVNHSATCACTRCDTSDRRYWGYNSDGEFVHFTDDEGY